MTVDMRLSFGRSSPVSQSATHTGRSVVWETPQRPNLSIDDDLLLAWLACLLGPSVSVLPSVRFSSLPACLIQAVSPPSLLPAFGGGGNGGQSLLLNACLLALPSHAAFAIPAASTFSLPLRPSQAGHGSRIGNGREEAG